MLNLYPQRGHAATQLKQQLMEHTTLPEWRRQIYNDLYMVHLMPSFAHYAHFRLLDKRVSLVHDPPQCSYLEAILLDCLCASGSLIFSSYKYNHALQLYQGAFKKFFIHINQFRNIKIVGLPLQPNYHSISSISPFNGLLSFSLK